MLSSLGGLKMIDEKKYVRQQITQYIASVRRELTKIDKFALTVLKAHLSIEALLDQTLELMVDRRKELNRVRLSFTQKAQLLRISVMQPGDDLVWEIVFALNTLRNEIAHRQDGERRNKSLDALRAKLIAATRYGLKRRLHTISDVEVIVQSTARCYGVIQIAASALDVRQKKWPTEGRVKWAVMPEDGSDPFLKP
jgi:hypothetical protein